MKEIWINLELYIKRYDFYNFRDFFWIFPDFSDLNFYLKTIKILKIIKKVGRGACVDATRHARPRGSATRTRAARPRGSATRTHAARHVAQYISYYIMYTYINGSLSSPIWGGSYPYRRSGIIYPTGSLN